MTIQENKRFVMEAYAQFMQGDIAGLLERYDDNADWIGPDSDIVPFAGSYHGKAGIAQFFQKLGESSQATRFDIKDCICEGNRVVVIGEASWLIKATGRTYDVPWTHVITLGGGKVVRFQTIYDNATAERAFSADVPAQPAAGTSLHH